MCRVLDPWPWAQAVPMLRVHQEVPPEDQRREERGRVAPAAQEGLELAMVGWGKFKETKEC